MQRDTTTENDIKLAFPKPGKNRKKKRSYLKTALKKHNVKSAKGKRCVRCNIKDGTVVPAHYSGFRKFFYGRGAYMKVDDRLVANLCARCHQEMDTPPPKEKQIEHSEEWLHLIALTLIDAEVG